MFLFPVAQCPTLFPQHKEVLNMKNYQKPAVEIISFQETENVMVSAVSYGLTEDIWDLSI